jgi:hypothetical protein
MKRRGGSYVLGVEATDAARSGLDPGYVERFDSAYESDDAGRLHAEAKGCSKRSHGSLSPSFYYGASLRAAIGLSRSERATPAKSAARPGR